MQKKIVPRSKKNCEISKLAIAEITVAFTNPSVSTFYWRDITSVNSDGNHTIYFVAPESTIWWIFDQPPATTPSLPGSPSYYWLDNIVVEEVEDGDTGSGSLQSTGYRYGFNGKEKDNEVSGDGNQYDYGFRIYNPRLGRFLSVDPLAYSYPYYTPYQFAGNMPVAAIDLDGLEQYVVVHYKDNTGRTYKIEITTAEDNAGNLMDQKVKKAINNKDGSVEQTGENIAKGNVLVFELYNEGRRDANLKIVRNTNDVKKDKLTPQELSIYKRRKRLMAEEGDEQSLIYPDGSNPKYASVALMNSLTKTFLSAQNFIIVPSSLSGNLGGLFSIGIHATLSGSNMPNGSLNDVGQP